MKSREIIRLTDNQVLMEAEKVGDLATADSTGIPEDILTTYLIETDTIRWDDTVTDSTFRAIKEVFQYAGESGIDPPKGIQASDEKAFFYCVPLSDSTGVTGVAVLTIPRKHIIINYSED